MVYVTTLETIVFANVKCLDDALEDVVKGLQDAVGDQVEAPHPAEQGGLDPHPQVAQLLRGRPEEGHPRHVGTGVQQELDRVRQLRPPLLWKGIQHAGKHFELQFKLGANLNHLLSFCFHCLKLAPF